MKLLLTILAVGFISSGMETQESLCLSSPNTPQCSAESKAERKPRPLEKTVHWVEGQENPPNPKSVALFWKKVKRGAPDECWPWIGYCTKRGYGQIGVRGAVLCTHRYSYMIAFGPIPTGAVVCHRCDNPPCNNPAHLFVGTQADNLEDCRKKNRANTARGEAAGRTKLTVSQVVEIRSLLRSGVPVRQISPKFGVTTGPIYAIKKGINWRHLL
jgi:hypothetical protein